MFEAAMRLFCFVLFQVPAPEQMLESLWDTDSDEVFDEVRREAFLFGLLRKDAHLYLSGRVLHVSVLFWWLKALAYGTRARIDEYTLRLRGACERGI